MMKKQKLESMIGKEMYSKAKEVLGNSNSVQRWFYTPMSAFNGRTPLEVYKDDSAIDVYNLLGRIEKGVFS